MIAATEALICRNKNISTLRFPIKDSIRQQDRLQNPQAHQCDQRYLSLRVDLQFPQYCYR